MRYNLLKPAAFSLLAVSMLESLKISNKRNSKLPPSFPNADAIPGFLRFSAIWTGSHTTDKHTHMSISDISLLAQGLIKQTNDLGAVRTLKDTRPPVKYVTQSHKNTTKAQKQTNSQRRPTRFDTEVLHSSAWEPAQPLHRPRAELWSWWRWLWSSVRQAASQRTFASPSLP